MQLLDEGDERNMKKPTEKPIKLENYTKKELIKIIKNLDNQLENAIKTVASYRRILTVELRTPHQYWEQYDEIVVDEEFEEDRVPPDFKEPKKGYA